MRLPAPTAARLALLSALALAGCQRTPSDRVQGYIEGEFVYVASPFAGALEKLSVERGAQVAKGAPLFALDSRAERAAWEEARRRIDQAKATLDDVRKGKRPAELDALDAQYQQAVAAKALSENEFARQEQLLKSGSAAKQEYDRAKATRDQDRQRVVQLEADLRTAKLGSRDDQVAAAEANVKAMEAALAKAEWDLAQKEQAAPQSALVFDTLYREGEWVGAGKPVVVLLPPPNVKLRAFVPETKVGTLQLGQPVQVTVDGVATRFTGKVSYISPRAEYTPPVIYSRDSRSKLVFLVEARFDATDAMKLHPGQPVDVSFGP